jgi:hypothetical protein
VTLSSSRYTSKYFIVGLLYEILHIKREIKLNWYEA